MDEKKISTGLEELDSILQGIKPGDNFVWQISSIDDYIPFVEYFARFANKSRSNLVYFRYGNQKKVIKDEYAATTIFLNPAEGFEDFVAQIIQIIEQQGPFVYYIFDLLDDLIVDWYSDVMVANFFLLICPYLHKMKALAYFSLLQNQNLSHSLRNIQNTAQIVINVYPHVNTINYYIYPEKVEKRHSSSIHMLHYWDRTEGLEGKLTPVRESGTITRIIKKTPLPELNFTVRRMDSWFVDFKKAQDLMEKLEESNYQFEEQKAENKVELKTEQKLQQSIEYIQEEENEIKIKIELLKNKLIRKVLPDDDRMRILAVNYLSLRDLIKIGKRMIGTGQIGGKTSGFLIARAIIRKNRPDMKERLEQHDSFFIGSHLFYTFLILNDCWEDRKRLTNKNTFLQGLQDIQRKILNGKFERYIIRQFREMLNYFGQSPIVVRSSSLQEDAFGNSFSGKYETIFCPNQGTPEQRLKNFISAIKRIYASAVSREALLYRQDRNLLVKDEEMALLVQRVSGIDYGQYFLPHIAGVGFSYNPFVWDEKIDPNSGFLRLVFGLGTRAVDRTGDDYTRLVALNAPNLRTSKDLAEIRKYSQYYIDVLNLKTNKLESIPYHRFFHMDLDIPISLFVTADPGAEQRAQQLGLKHSFTSILTLTPILNNSNILQDLGDILSELQKAYSFPVDIEFTINFRSFKEYTIHLLQCRPFQVTQETKGIKTPENIEQSNIVIKFKGPVIGTSRNVFVDRLIYISPHDYSELSIQEKYLIARIIGNINLNYCSHSQNIMLIGPGRWGTSSPNLGVPITYEEINKISIIGEIAEMHDHLIPDISLGTHFFNNIVENNLLYFALNTDKGEYYQNLELLKDEPNKLLDIMPHEQRWASVIKIYDFLSNSIETNKKLVFFADAISQSGILFFKSKK